MSNPEETVVFTADQIREITTQIIDGLCTDGAHHKQWHLENLLQLIVPDEFEDAKADWQWEEGIPS